jgi:hypothetical protein
VLSANRKLVARHRGKSLENGIVGKFDSKKSMTRKASQTDMALMKNAGTTADKTACFRVMSVCHAFPSCFSGPIFVRFIWQRVDANQHAWSRPIPTTAARNGKQTGFTRVSDSRNSRLLERHVWSTSGRTGAPDYRGLAHAVREKQKADLAGTDGNVRRFS